MDPLELFYSVKGGRSSRSSIKNPDYITKEDLLCFIREYATFNVKEVNMPMIESIMKRVDKDLDEQVKYYELLEFVSP